MPSAEVVNIIAPTEHQRTVMELAWDWRKAQPDFEHTVGDSHPQFAPCDDGQRVIIIGFPAAALPVLKRGNIPFELHR